ncbi:FMN-binding protein [Streptomyces sp. NPDC048111]|uniref:FMN-binding protein n=1 Tax=Streptomyces sp. NPDC048111 TaxID=3365500 RepID=UPI00371E093F
MRRAVLATTGISALVVTLLALKPHQPAPLAATAPRSPTAVRTPAATSTSAPTGTGTFTGDPVETRYGTVQVSATLADGRITSVAVLQAPEHNGRDQELTAYAVPRLTEEALGAQSAHIDAVSGASYTSEGYIQSLQSALDQARA